MAGNLAGILQGFLWTHKIKVQKFRGKFWSIFRENIRSSKKYFVQTSFCRCATRRNRILGPQEIAIFGGAREQFLGVSRWAPFVSLTNPEVSSIKIKLY